MTRSNPPTGLKVRLVAVLFFCQFLVLAARAQAQAPGVVVFCEPSLQFSLVAAGRVWQARTQVPVRVLTASLEQNARLILQGARADILIGIGAERIDQAQQLGALRPGSPTTRYGELAALPQESQITRHVCVEGWSMIGKWTGTPLRTFLTRVGADLRAKNVGFVSADGYFESIDMPTALHPQTIMAFGYGDGPLPTELGFPFKIRIPTKLGFKGPKWVTAMYVTNRYPGGFWSDRGYNWFSGS